MDDFWRPSWAWLPGWSPLGTLRDRWGLGVFFSIRFWKGLFSILGGFWKGFGSPTWSQNRFLGRFFRGFFQARFWHRFWTNFWKLETLKIAISSRREHDFYKIDVFKKWSQNDRFWVRFWMPKRWNFYEKSYLKTCLFKWSNFWRFFSVLVPFWEALGAQGPPKKSIKIDQDAQKIDFEMRFGHVCFWRWVLEGFWDGFGRNLAWFWKDFAKVLEGFWKDFWKILGR